MHRLSFFFNKVKFIEKTGELNFMNLYKTVEKEAISEFLEKKSKFIGYISPIESEEKAIEFINKIKAKHRDARHNVYAYTILKDNISRYSDDGEPHGTAGLPIMGILNNYDLKNTVIVVTRYFGGVLLGKGGLVRAYSKAAVLSIKKAKVITMALCQKCKISCDYNRYPKIISSIRNNNAIVLKEEFTDKIDIEFYSQDKNLEKIRENINLITSGTVSFDIIGKNFYKI